MSRNMLAAIGGGALSGLLYVGALGGVLGLALFMELPLFLAGLGLGTRAAVVAGVAGVIPVLFAGGAEAALNFAMTTAAPVVVLSRQALLWRRAEESKEDVEWYPPGLLITWLAGIALALLLAAMLVFSGTEGGLAAVVRESTLQVLTRLYPNAESTRIEAFATAIAPVVPGIALSGWTLLVAGNGIAAQALLARFGRALRPSARMEALTLPHWLPLALAGCAALALLGGPAGFFGANAFLVLGVPFFFAGLGVVHALVRKSGAGTVALVVFYGLTAAFGWPVVLIAVLGLIDQWVDFRARWLRDAVDKEG
ncbi:MAG TPA: DUF2232 domain-containing protein [Alphaproteobacteria bacterium]|nr:DUF2232 domain-containing protein [Alphaproteobacteria bacterium]